MRSRRRIYAVLLILAVISVMSVSSVFCAERTEQYIPDSSAAEEGMTMWQIIKAGGSVMVFLALLSIVALALVVYYFISIKPDRLLPEDLLDDVIGLIEKNDYGKVRQRCEESPDSLVSTVVLAGLTRQGRGKVLIKEAMEDEGRRSTDSIWQKLSYLADVAAISPMVGLLGTVLGMIQAFNVIAFQAGAVKPVLLASGISKAMVTTAAGLIIAIPSMVFYSFFRGIVQDITARLENVSTELWHLMTEKEK